jgi:trigger factor
MTDEKPEEGEGGTTTTEPASENAGEEAAEKPKKLKQSVEMRDTGPCKKHIKVSIDRGDIDSRLDEQYSKLVTDSSVPGFRPGKAPRKVIERRFHKDVFDQVKGEIMLQSLEQLAEDNDVAPLSPPDLDPTKIEIPKEGPLVYEFEVEVRPQFDLPNYKGLKLRRPVQTFTDDDVAAEERRILARYSQLVPKPKGNAQIGDVLIADLTSYDGDQKIGEFTEQQLQVESRLVFKDGVAENFGDQVKGAKPGDTKQIEIKLSDAAAAPQLRGKTVKAKLNVKEVKSLRPPELTEEFLSRFGVHSPEQFRERIRVVLQRRLEYTQRQVAREQVLAQIAAASTWDLPNDLLQRQARKALARKIMDMRASGIPEEEIVARQRLLQQDTLRSTALALKEHFVMQKIAEEEKLDVDDDDLNDEIERIAVQNEEPPRRVRARLEKEDLLDALAAEIIERKALDLVLEHAEYEDVPIDKKTQEKPTAAVEQQMVSGELHDPTAAPPEEKQEKEEGTPPSAQS